MYPTLPVQGYALDTLPMALLVLGAALGFVLERAGMGSARQNIDALSLKDPRSYRFVFATLFTLAVCLWVYAGLGKLDLSYVSLPELPMGPMLIAGALFGVGLAVGGFGPTLAVVGLGRGRLDALGFLGGVVAAVLLFGNTQGGGGAVWQQPAAGTPMVAPAPFAPGWILAAALGLVGLGVMFALAKIAPETPDTEPAKDSAEGETPETAPAPAASSLWLKVGPALVGVGVVALVATQGMHAPPMSVPDAAASEPRATVLDGSAPPTVDALSMASWMVIDAHRVANELTPNVFFVDLRPASEREALALPTALTPEIALGGDDAGLESAFTALSEQLVAEHLNKPFVFIAHADDAEVVALVGALRQHGINAMTLDGGIEAWQAQVLDENAEWPAWPVHAPIIVHHAEPAPAPAHPEEPPTDAHPEEVADVPEGDVVPAEVVAEPEPEPEPEPDPSVFDWEVGPEFRASYRAWLSGESDELPARLAIPGTIPLPTEVFHVEGGGGGGGGGCG